MSEAEWMAEKERQGWTYAVPSPTIWEILFTHGTGYAQEPIWSSPAGRYHKIRVWELDLFVRADRSEYYRARWRE